MYNKQDENNSLNKLKYTDISSSQKRNAGIVVDICTSMFDIFPGGGSLFE